MPLRANVLLYGLLTAYLFLCVASNVNAAEPIVSTDVANADKTRARWVSAISSDNTKVLNEIFEQGRGSGNTVTSELLTLSASNGKTALMVASKVGDEAFAKALVQAGANIRAKTITDGTAFMFAVLGDQKPIAQWLLNLGADINAQGSNGWTSVMIAAAKGLDETLAWLLNEGANAATPDVYGFTPLMRAVDNNHNESVGQLLNVKTVDVNWQDEVANTALHYAVSNNNLANVNQLIEAGAKPSVKNLSGDTPWSLAHASGKNTSTNDARQAAIEKIKSVLQQELDTQ